MFDQRVNKAISEHSERFMQGRLDAILPRYAEVMPVYIDGKVMLINGHEELREALFIHRDKVLSRGVTSLVGQVRARSQVRDRIRFTIDWTYGWRHSAKTRTGTSVYFCKKRDEGILIEMMEIKTLAFPDAPCWQNTTSHLLRPTCVPNPTYLH